MGKRRWVRSHVERLLQDEWDTCRVRSDSDGDYFFRAGTAACWVQVMADPEYVRVFAHAACGVKPSAKLLTELNQIQARATTVAVFVSGEIVIVQQTLIAHGLNRHTLRQALLAVSTVADDIGQLVAGMFDGQTPFTAEASVDEAAS